MGDLSYTQLTLSAFALLAALFYLYMLRAFRYWSKRQIPTLPPSFPFGHFGRIVTGQETVILSVEKTYNTFKRISNYAGYYMFGAPVLIALNPEVIRNIMVKDFQYFHDRGVYFNEDDDPLSAHLFAIEGQKWKTLRAKLSPTFTSGKMKNMFPTMVENSNNLEKHIKEKVSKGAQLEVKDILARFTTDMIGTCALGIQCNSLKDQNAEFRVIGKKVFTPTLWGNIKQAFATAFRNLSKSLHIKITNQEVTNFFISAVTDTMQYREKNKITRNDFLQLLMQLQSKGYLDGEEGKERMEPLTMNEAAAQAFAFYAAGFETSSSAMSFCLYELALNPECQRKARDEIHSVLAKYDGRYTYEALSEMKYVDMAIDETLRKYPTLPVLNRECAKDYKLPGTNTVIPRGTPIFIPVGGLHHDPQYYPEPDKFDPERFTEENKAKRHHFAYLPFGEGPRICIGMRFGMMQTRLGLITLIKDYEIKPCAKTEVPLKMDPKSFLTTTLGGIWLHFEPLSK
uniref:Putative cytochrome n=1 Tax=Xenopsylla cheopis TaxID=163159 RepID=A0A6M2DYQ8_XENCH